ncbi:SdpI family protein [Dyadobacter sandarakinus]|uniref:SdpI family protein n=1 Tax=Dyadobacter sandarakinus TaxID=2747268 RepID=A0ABX7I2S8_9BACT|nr:SdpI family protein [Dyadobacter sandarakinus]QRR00180.1 SdpI family protein [Dyadobacter sandarakinus]
MDIILLGHAGFMLCSFVVAMAVRFFKPGKINPLLGYRTPLAMKSEEAWREANRYSTRIQVWLSLSFCMLAAASYLLIGGITSFYLCSFLLAVTSISVIPITEYHLRQEFDSNGKRLS